MPATVRQPVSGTVTRASRVRGVSVPPAHGSFTETVKLLGGRQTFKKPFTSALDVHEAIQKGIPGGALIYMVEHAKEMKPADLLKAVGVSVRTVQRRSEAPEKPLSQEQSGRAWKFAEVLAAAMRVVGSQAAAEKWLTSPAMALNRRRPIDLMSSPAGAQMVEELLGRLEYGVYT